MPKSPKYNLDELKKLFVSVKGERKLFIEKAQENPYNVPKKYAQTLHYNFKKSGVISTESQIVQQAPSSPVEPPAEPVVVETIKPTDVKVEHDAPKPETIELRDRYKKMFEEVNTPKNESKYVDTSPAMSAVTNEEGEIEPESEPSVESPSDGGFGAIEETPAQRMSRTMKIKLGQLLYQVGVSVDNNLLWRERPLSTEEKETIREFSNDLQTEYSGILDSEYAPWINYGLAVVALPALSRIDLLPSKIEGAIKFFNSGQPLNLNPVPQHKPQTNPNTNAPQPKPDSQGGFVVDRPKPSVVDLNKYQGSARSFVQDCINRGMIISPNYQDGGPLDRDAYMQGILRNMGDRFNG